MLEPSPISISAGLSYAAAPKDLKLLFPNIHYEFQCQIGGSGKLTQFRALGSGLGAEIAAAVLLELDDHTYAPIHDHSGHMVVIVDADSSTLTEHYRYSVFGEEQTCSSFNPWSFASKRHMWRRILLTLVSVITILKMADG